MLKLPCNRSSLLWCVIYTCWYIGVLIKCEMPHPEKHMDVYVLTEYTVCVDKTVTCKVKVVLKQCPLVF